MGVVQWKPYDTAFPRSRLTPPADALHNHDDPAVPSAKSLTRTCCPWLILFAAVISLHLGPTAGVHLGLTFPTRPCPKRVASCMHA